MYCKGYFFTCFSKSDYSYLEFVFPFKGSEELMHINVNMKYNVKQMLLYVIPLRDTAEENKTFCKLYVMVFFKCENAFYFKTFHYLYYTWYTWTSIFSKHCPELEKTSTVAPLCLNHGIMGNIWCQLFRKKDWVIFYEINKCPT